MLCSLCGSKNISLVRDKIRHTIPRRVFRCEECTLIFLDPQKKDWEKYYREEYRQEHTPVQNTKVSARELFDIYLPFQEARVAKGRKYLKRTMHVLDIGSSTGHFLRAIKPYVKEVVGNEYNSEYAKFANEELGITTHTARLEKTGLRKGSFDLISVLEVLEHVDEPLSFLKRIGEYLKPSGILYIEVPNLSESLLSLFAVPGYGEFYYREPHLFYYSPKTLRLLLAKAGFAGRIKASGFEPNFLNQLHWIMENKPQKSDAEVYAPPKLPFRSAANPLLRRRMERLLTRLNREYRAFLDTNLLSSHIIFIGKKKKR